MRAGLYAAVSKNWRGTRVSPGAQPTLTPGYSPAVVDEIFRTCCFHNTMVLEISALQNILAVF